MSSQVKGRVYSSFKVCEIHRMPPTCCRCNASGRCKNCSFKNRRKYCSICQPSRLGKCANVQQPNARTDGQATAMTLPPGNHTDSIMPDAACGKHVNIQIESASQEHVPLPPFNRIQEPNFQWRNMDGETFAHSISCCYPEIVHWKRNLFKIPSGKLGILLVKEITKLFQSYADRSALESIAIKAAMVIPALLLQKSHPNSKAKYQKFILEHRLKT